MYIALLGQHLTWKPPGHKSEPRHQRWYLLCTCEAGGRYLKVVVNYFKNINTSCLFEDKCRFSGFNIIRALYGCVFDLSS